MAKKKKIRVEMRKNRSKPARQSWKRGLEDDGHDNLIGRERVRSKGELSRKRTIIQEDSGGAGGAESAEMPAVDVAECLPGRVIKGQGLLNLVHTEDGRVFRCGVRRLLKTLATDERNAVVTGDRVWIRPVGPACRAGPDAPATPLSAEENAGPVRQAGPAEGEGFIERVEPRRGLLTRASRGREHVLVANVDQVVIVVSLVEPALKPHLIDRYLVSAEQGGIAPVVCLNKADLVEPVPVQPLIGYYSQLGIPAFLTSAVTGLGIDRLRRLLKDRESVIAGQSGVGKSSLLNAIQPGLDLHVREVSEANQKGRHTTTTAELIKLDAGGWVVDTPGIRQFQLWDMLPQELEGFFPEFRPYVHLCAFPDCTHTHEERCAIKKAVARHQIGERRYLSYLGMFSGQMEE